MGEIYRFRWDIYLFVERTKIIFILFGGDLIKITVILFTVMGQSSLIFFFSLFQAKKTTIQMSLKIQGNP